ncbi:MAG: glucosaminidase domain-containing protein [Tannerella sp.]|jgi:LysM repeat protein|nr:glucosaminidase domain-containing protein [Tannerella sp.]
MKINSRFLFVIVLMAVNIFFAHSQRTANIDKYINTYKQLAIEQEQKYKIPASIKLAQAILESGAGTSYLSKEANNHFGIKCHVEWKGDRAYKDAEIRNECFRKYKSIADSYEDHSRFLIERSRYERLFTLKTTNYTEWAKGLQECGYATDKGYANKLISLIERYQLYQYTNVQSGKSKTTSPPINNQTTQIKRDIYKTYGLIYVIVRFDDSLAQIAYDLGFSTKQLAKYNDIPVNFPIQQGDIIYLEKKKSKADQPNQYHTVRVGESMHNISQRYGIQLKSLYKINKKKTDYVPVEGDMLILR